MTETEFNKIFSENLNYYLTLKKSSQAELAKYLDVSATSVMNWCRGIKTPRMDKVDKMCKFFNISRSDLMNERKNNTTESTNTIRAVRINVFGRVPAGTPLEAITDIVDWEEIPADWTAGGQEYIALKVKGDSMHPKYVEDDTIIVRLQQDCESGQDAVVYVNGYDATLKKVVKSDSGIMLQPINAAYETKFYPYFDASEEVRILGVVVEIRRKV